VTAVDAQGGTALIGSVACINEEGGRREGDARWTKLGVILKAFSLRGQGVHRRIGALWPPAMGERKNFAEMGQTT